MASASCRGDKAGAWGYEACALNTSFILVWMNSREDVLLLLLDAYLFSPLLCLIGCPGRCR